MDLGSIVRNITATGYLTIAGVVMLIYDHILTFPDEVELVWKAQWNTPKTLFLFMRYLVPPCLIIHLHQLSGISTTGLSTPFCKAWFGISVVFGILSMGIANFLVLLHIWNLWDRDRRLMYSTYVLFVLTQITQLACAGVLIFNLVGSLSYSINLKHCVLANNSMLFLIYAPGLIFDAVACGLAAYMSLGTPRNAATKLSFVLYRDGLAYYVPLVSLRVINIILATVAPPSLQFLCTYFLWAVGLTTVNRLLLRLRRISVRRSSGGRPVYDGYSFEMKEGHVVDGGA